MRLLSRIPRFTLLATLLALFFITGCRATRKINTAINKNEGSSVVKINESDSLEMARIRAEMYDRVMSNHLTFETFSSRVRVDFEDNSGQKNSATANVRMASDSLIWISLTGPLGVEGYRALIKPDSVIIMNKLERSVTYASMAYLQQITSLPLQFRELQDLLIGNPVFFTQNIVSLSRNGSNIQILSIGPEFKNLVTVDSSTNAMLHSKLNDINELRNRTCDIRYADYQVVAGKNFPATRNMVITEKSILNIALNFRQVTFDQPQDYPYNIPKSYEVIRK